jgi:hypothetical protein
VRWKRLVSVLLALCWIGGTTVACGSVQAGGPAPSVRAQVRVEGRSIRIHASVANFDMRYGHFHVELDGELVAMTPGPDFVIEDVPPGRHQVVVQVARNDNMHTILATTVQDIDVP